MLRAARWLAIGAVGLFAVLWIGCNIFVRGGFLESLVNAATDEIRLELTDAWSPYPGRVRAERLDMRFGDSENQFFLRVDDMGVTVDLLGLLRRSFNGSRIEGDVIFRMRRKLRTIEGNEQRAAAFPQIEGFEDPPILEDPDAPASDPDPERWVIDLQDIDIAVNEFWMMEYRYTGTMRVSGGFRFQPTVELTISPSTVTLGGGKIATGSQRLAEPVTATVQATLHRVLVADIQGQNIFGKIDAAIGLEAYNLELEPLSSLYASDSGVRLQTPGGHLNLKWVLAKGKLREAHTTFQASPVIAKFEPFTLAGPLSLETRLLDAGRPGVELSATSDVIAASVPGEPPKSGAAAPQVRKLRSRIVVHGTELHETLSLGAGSLSVGEIAVPNLAWFNRVLGSTIFRSGTLGGSAELALEDSGDLLGDIQLKATQAKLRIADSLVVLSGTLAVAKASLPNQGSGLINEIELHVSDATVAGGEHWWFRAAGTGVRFERDGAIDARFDIAASSAEPLVPILVEQRIVRAAIGLLKLDNTQGKVRLVRRPPDIWVSFDQITSGNLRVDGGLHNKKQRTCGAFLVDTPVSDVGVLLDPSDGVSLKPFADMDWLRKQMPRIEQPPRGCAGS